MPRTYLIFEVSSYTFDPTYSIQVSSMSKNRAGSTHTAPNCICVGHISFRTLNVEQFMSSWSQEELKTVADGVACVVQSRSRAERHRPA